MSAYSGLRPKHGLQLLLLLHLENYIQVRLETANLASLPFFSPFNISHFLGLFSIFMFFCFTSVSEVLQMCSEDAEETLYELGFGCEEPQVAIRIPPRFLTFPSQAKGINFRRFLESQLRRIREEDPSISLASKTNYSFYVFGMY